jgi:hypothetical protein
LHRMRQQKGRSSFLSSLFHLMMLDSRISFLLMGCLTGWPIAASNR